MPARPRGQAGRDGLRCGIMVEPFGATVTWEAVCRNGGVRGGPEPARQRLAVPTDLRRLREDIIRGRYPQGSDLPKRGSRQNLMYPGAPPRGGALLAVDGFVEMPPSSRRGRDDVADPFGRMICSIFVSALRWERRAMPRVRSVGCSDRPATSTALELSERASDRATVPDRQRTARGFTETIMS